MIRFLAACAFALCLVVPAEAKPSHQYVWKADNDGKYTYEKRTVTRHVKKPRYRKHKVVASHRAHRNPAVRSRSLRVAHSAHQKLTPPARFISGRLICAVNVNAALAARGIKGTGSRMAKSFLRWGKPTTPVPGAVAIYSRGRDPAKGHVAIVSRIVNGRVHIWNPSPRGWREVVYRKRPIAYRVAG